MTRILGMACLLLAIAGCSSDRAKLTDADLKKIVQDRIATDPELSRTIDVSANASTNEVILKGDVATEQARGRAVELAKAAKADITVTDKIDVKPRELTRSDYTEEMARQARVQAKSQGETVGESIDDAWIHTKIVAKLVGNSTTPARRINVDVVKKVVTLRGEVPTPAAKAEAERTAQETEGVARVRNLLRVSAG